MRSRWLFAITLSTAVVGCAGTGGESARANALTAGQLSLADGSDIIWPAANWWLGLNDVQLNQLIELAQRSNPSLRIAQARVELAQSAVRGTRAVNQPALDLNAEINRERFSENDIYPAPLGGSVQNHARVALDFSYEFDFWGKQRATLAAALTETDIARADRSATQMVLSIAVAQSYFALQQALADQTLAAQIKQQRDTLLTLTQLRVQRGLASSADIDPTQAAAANAQRNVARAQQDIDIEIHRLAALCGTDAEQLPRLTTTTLDIPELAVPRAIPADLLGRRADIAAQRLRIEAETKYIVAAKAEFYPNVDLTAFFGVQSVSTGQLFSNGSRIWGAGPALHLPIFNRDALRAQLGSRYSNYDIAVEQYNQSVLSAVRETADAGSALQAVAAQRAAIQVATQALQRARDTAQLRHQRGLGNQLDAISAEIALLEQQLTANSVRAAQTQAQLALIKALGGGYSGALAEKN
jgi:NodT family efflux transporter outer membrane factor (OMF) lipoprotein